MRLMKIVGFDCGLFLWWAWGCQCVFIAERVVDGGWAMDECCSICGEAWSKRVDNIRDIGNRFQINRWRFSKQRDFYGSEIFSVLCMQCSKCATRARRVKRMFAKGGTSSSSVSSLLVFTGVLHLCLSQIKQGETVRNDRREWWSIDVEMCFVRDVICEPVLFCYGDDWLFDCFSWLVWRIVWNDLFLKIEKDFECLSKKCHRAGTCEGIVVRLVVFIRTKISKRT